MLKDKNLLLYIVSEKEYKKETLVPMVDGKTIIPTTIPVRYLLTVTYDKVNETFNNKELYENIQKGDQIRVILCNYYDRNYNLIDQRIKLRE